MMDVGLGYKTVTPYLINSSTCQPQWLLNDVVLEDYLKTADVYSKYFKQFI